MSFIVASIVGFLSGILASMGLGGGFILVVYFAIFTDFLQKGAQGINLLFFIPGAVISSVFRWKQGSLNIKKILPAVVLGCIGAGVFSVLGKCLNARIFKKLFGVLLLLTGVREFFYRPRKAR